MDQSCSSARRCFQCLNPDTVPLHDERIITVREEPSLHVESLQRDVTSVKRSGEWLNRESRNLVPGDLMKLTLGGFIPAVWTCSRGSRLHVRMSKKSGWNHGCDLPSRVPLKKSTHIEIRDVVCTFFVSFNGEVQRTMDFFGHVLPARTDRMCMSAIRGTLHQTWFDSALVSASWYAVAFGVSAHGVISVLSDSHSVELLLVPFFFGHSPRVVKI